MKRYAALYGGLLAVMALLFAAAEALNIPFLADPTPVQGLTGAFGALSGVMLLLVDIALPVPSSVVMITLGALFGIPLGMILSMAGSLGSFAIGFALGRRGSALAARVVPDAERRRADRVLRRWGLVGIILSRPIPILAETVSFVVGASSLCWRPALVAAALGYLPAAAVYTVAGSLAVSFHHGAAVFLVVVLLAGAAAVVVAHPTPAGPKGRERDRSDTGSLRGPTSSSA